MVDHSAENRDIERLMSIAAKFHGIDVPVQAYREEGNDAIITVQGGIELRCKIHDLYSGETKVKPDKKPRASGAQKSASVAKPPQK